VAHRKAVRRVGRVTLRRPAKPALEGPATHARRNGPRPRIPALPPRRHGTASPLGRRRGRHPQPARPAAL